MPILSDQQRVELAIPAYFIYALTAAPGVFVPADPNQTARVEADIAALRSHAIAVLLPDPGSGVGNL